MNSMTVFQNAQLPAAFRNGPVAGMGDLTEGVSAGFPVVSFKGKVWKIKARGEETIWVDQAGMPVSYVDVVVVNGSSHVSKQHYVKKFADGDEAGAPDCWSLNGVRPDKSVGEPIHTSCASCPKNQWGSRVSDAGKQGKACQDNRRLAIVPYATVLNKNEAYGGPMLLRIPPTSLQELATFQKKMASLGFPYYAVAVRISFDLNLAYPKLLFTPLQPLTNDEAQAVVEMATDEMTQRMLNEAVDHTANVEPEKENVDSVFLNAAPANAVKPQATPTVTAAVAQVAAVAAVVPAAVVIPSAANDENPLVAQLRPLVAGGLMSKEAFKAATGVDFDPPAPPVVEKAPWAPKAEHIALAQLVEAGSLDVAVFKQVSGYDYEGPLPSPLPPVQAKPVDDVKPKATRAKKETAAAAPIEQVTDAVFTEKPGLDAALDNILGG
jgi:hypothetical protein